MKFLSILAAVSLNAFSAHFVFNYQELHEKRISLKENDLYKKSSFGRLVQTDFEKIGEAISPIYKEGTSYFRLYQKSNRKCFKVEIRYGISVAHRSNCEIPRFEIILDGTTFHDVSNTFNLDGIRFTKFTTNTSKEISGFHDTIFEVLGDGDISKHSFSSFDVFTSIKREFRGKENRLEVLTKAMVSRTKFNYYPLKVKEVNQSLKFEVEKGDRVFQSGSKFLLFKRYQPRPLNFKYLTLNSSYENYLQSIEDFLHTTDFGPKCFRRAVTRRHHQDCSHLIFDNLNHYSYIDLNLVLIDLEKLIIESI